MELQATTVRDFRYHQLIAVVFIAVSTVSEASACSSPVTPSNGTSSSTSTTTVPAVQIVGLRLAPDITSLKVGGKAAFSAYLLMSDDTRRQVEPAWAVDAPTVGTVDRTGVMTAIASGVVTIRATFDTYSEIRTLRIVPDFQGSWQGQYRIDTCTRISGNGTNPCRIVEGALFILRLDMQHSGADDLSGELTFFSSGEFPDVPGPAVETGPINGRILTDSSITIEATTKGVQGEPRSRTLSDWITSPQSTSILVGRYIGNRTFENAFGTQVVREDCSIVKLQRK